MSHDELPRPAAAAGTPDSQPLYFRQIIAQDWVDWTVIEIQAAQVPGSQGAHYLLFMRIDCIRRVWHYPADWRALDDAGLAALSWKR